MGKVVITDDYRVGEALLVEAVGSRAIELNCHEGNEKARGFYRAVGFEQHGDENGGMLTMKRKRGWVRPAS